MLIALFLTRDCSWDVVVEREMAESGAIAADEKKPRRELALAGPRFRESPGRGSPTVVASRFRSMGESLKSAAQHLADTMPKDYDGYPEIYTLP
jgi:hypothetical protein